MAVKRFKPLNRNVILTAITPRIRSSAHLHALLLALPVFLLPACSNNPSGDPSTDEVPSAPLFTLLPPEQTGIDFQNTLSEGLNTNILMYEYFYNGGGVAAGDLNGDGLIDLYFTSNMSDNKLYLNQGDMKFRDVTAISGASGKAGPWKTGVTIADVNGDNKPDLYICYSGALPDEKRINQLFINKGNSANNVPLFEERAAEYGLASPGFSNQAYFFDCDRDGDLDVLLLNHNPQNLPILNEVSTAEFLKKDDVLRGVRLYKQENGVFRDATEQSGISGSALTYGLGAGITDVNNDGWPDFYISNDYAVPDYLYINNHDGTFTNQLKESVGHNSQFSMGNDIADINNDNWPDIVTLDMLPEDNHRQKLLLSPDNYAKFDLNVRSGFHYQYMRNMLQLNNGATPGGNKDNQNVTFSEIGQLAGISNTDWSWSALLADYDNDGWKDLMVTNGYFRDYTNLDFIKYMDDYTQAKGRLVREDVLEIISHMPASDVVNYVFANQNGQHFTDKTKAWGLNRPSNSNGAAYADLDNDGDLDLIVNNINQPAFIYRNETSREDKRHFLQVRLLGEGGNTQGIGAKVTITCSGKKQSLEQILSRGYLSAVSPVLHFGLGAESAVDTLTVRWNSGKQQVLTGIQADQVLELAEKDAAAGASGSPSVAGALFAEVDAPVSFRSPAPVINDFDRQPLLISEFSFAGPCMTSGDVNDDGSADLLIGGARGQASALFLGRAGGKFVQQAVPVFDADQGDVDGAAAIFDADGDGFQDVYVAAGGYHDFEPGDAHLQDRLYLGDGRGGFTRSAADALPDLKGSSKSCIAVQDINGDGHPDLFVGGRVSPGRYPESPRSYLLVNDGKGRFTDQTAAMAPDLQSPGMVTAATWTDLNGDGSPELILTGEWMPVRVFGLTGGKLTDRTPDFFDKTYKGWWNTVSVADLNSDGKPDIIAGNMGTNTQFRVSEQEPAELYFKDFDDNGSIDPIFCFYIQGKSYPYVTRDELLRQLSGLRRRFTTYESYADATIADIFKPADLANAGHLEADHMETTVFLSGPGGKLKPAALPVEAQYGPVYAIAANDFNKDGNPDILLCGNSSHFKLRLGKFDANYGTLLLGDGQGRFRYVDQARSGFHLQGDVRSVMELADGTLLFGVNREKVRAYRGR